MRLHLAKFHFVGVGGIGMCGLAELLHNIGAQVSGSDLSENANTLRLKKLGVRVFQGHSAENVGDADVVVYSSAVSFENPELVEARAKKIPLIPRAEALAEIMRLKRGIAVAGTHGKTTTTSMVSSIFYHSEQNPTIFIGGRFDLIDSTAHLGTGEWLIAEADESDGSFHKLTPEIAIITNIDSDHLDHFKNFENLQRSFYDFALKVPFYGLTIVCGDDPKVRKLFEKFPKRILFYGFDFKNDIVLQGEKGQYQFFQKEMFFKTTSVQTKDGYLLGQFKLQLPGRHNALNATAAALAGLTAGLSPEQVQNGIAQYRGVDRRFQFKGENKQILVYDDYGHHPTEIRATLEAFKEKFPDRRLVVYFQPHRYSRTQSCWTDFVDCFKLVDVLFLADIYPAGEKPIPGITSQRLLQEVAHKSSYYLTKSDSVSAKILSQLKANDVFLTLGAGDGWKLGLEILEKLKEN